MNKPQDQAQAPSSVRTAHDPLVCLLVLVAAGLFFFRLGGDSIRSINEGFYAEGAREMLESGDWITPRFNYELRFQKPPLTYWLIAVCYKLIGVRELAARLPSATLAALSLLVTYGVGKAFFDKRVALLGSLALGTGLGHIHTAQSATPGIIFSFFIWLSLLGFVRAYTAPQAGTRWLLVAYGAAGLAVLAKGPGGIVLPALAGLLFLLVNRNLRALKRLGLWWGIPLAVVIPAAWYVAVYQLHGSEPIRLLLLEENIQRYTSFAQKRGPLWYTSVWPVEFFPWALLVVPAALYALLPSGRGGAGGTGLRFCWAALIGWFVFFSVARDKGGHYIMPLHMPAALVVAHMFARLSDGSARGSLLVRGLAGFLAVFCMLILIAAVAFVLLEVAPAAGWEAGFWAGPAAVAALLWIGLRRRWPETPELLLMLACLMMAFEMLLLSHVWPRIETIRPYREIATVIARERPERVGAYNMGTENIPLRKTSLPFYARQRVEPLRDAAELRAFLRQGKGRVCVAIDERDYRELGLSSTPRLRTLGRWRYLHRPDPREYNVLKRLRPGEEHEYVLLISKG
ncbi:MAG: ArnT family glycosyltransferase [Armatimonadota bacterium]